MVATPIAESGFKYLNTDVCRKRWAVSIDKRLIP
jgi:hypothetical protein